MSVESHMPSSDYHHPKKDDAGVKKDTRPEGAQDEVCSSADNSAAAAERDRLSGLIRSAIHSPPPPAIAAAASAVTPPPHASQPLQLISLIQQIKMRLESFTNDNSDPMEDDL